MASAKKYYWIKLSTDFMNSDAVDYLMGLKNGAVYMMLYECLCIMAINTGGVLATNIAGKSVPYDVERIRRNAKWFTSAQISSGIELFEQIGLLEKCEHDAYKVTNFSELVGCETDAALRMRRSRYSRTKREQCSNNVTPEREQNAKIVTPEQEQDQEQDQERESSSSCGIASRAEIQPEERPDFDALEVYAANNLRSMSPYNLEELVSFRDSLTDELIRHGIDEACAAGAPTWRYARSILNRFVDSGYKSIGDVVRRRKVDNSADSDSGELDGF